jgi:hypothetical protein
LHGTPQVPPPARKPMPVTMRPLSP